MTESFKKYKKDLLFLPLGGSGEIGMNMNLYHLDGKWLMIDCGAGFAEDFLPGIDMIVPDFSFIHKRQEDLVGLVLTHAHEDHLGAIPHLWHEFHCPIYATPFTAAFLRAKLADNDMAGQANIIEVAPGSKFKVAPFDLELVELTHSAPEMNAVMLRTPHGNVFHSGDWKLDPSPMVGPASDKAKIKKYGDEGVLAMVSDSTNVFSPGTAGSEGDLRESMIELVGQCKQLVVVTTFASNVARIETIAVAAREAGRRVVLAGRSLWRIVRAAQETGYLTDLEFFEDDIIGKYPRNKLLVLSTGCQGEPMAATSKIASDSHRSISLKPNDTMIFSSKIIPGNDKRINRLFNQLVKMDIEVLTERDHFVHVSGHPNRDDLKTMYDLVRPQISIPVHGEDVHMQEHVRLATEWGVKKAIKIENGQVLRLAPGEPEKVSIVDSGILAIDGNFLLPADSSIIRTRRKMQREGVVVVVLLMNKNGLVRDPLVFAPGVLDRHDDKDIYDAINEEIYDAIDNAAKVPKGKKPAKHLDNLVRGAIRRVLRPETGKSPPIEVHIEHL